MKLICLNIWGGKIYQPLIDFLKIHSKDIDIFCFQEALNSKKSQLLTGPIFKTAKSDIHQDLVFTLKEFQEYYGPGFDLQDWGGEADFEVPMGLAIFVKKNLKVKQTGNIYVHGSGYKDVKKDEGYANAPKAVQFVNFEKDGKYYSVFNYHGVWIPGHKIDHPYRIEASKNIRKIMDSKEGEKILCGDFNLLPDTLSLEILTDGMRDLIKENKITSTRTKYFDRDLSQYSDYMIVSNDVDVKDFQILKDEVSDHAPLLLEFD